jgi:hypothetical protein
MKTYPKSYFVNEDAIEKANQWGLTSIENFDLTTNGLIAKMEEWDEENRGVDAYVYDITKKTIEEEGGVMPSHILRIGFNNRI